MEKKLSESEEWLKKEDSVTFEDRVARLDWVVDNLPAANYWTFPGGLLSKYLFEEARYSFVYGQFLASTLLGLSYIERTLAALFYGARHDDLERVGLAVLLQKANEVGWLNEEELTSLERARELRNRIAHFRRPGHADSIEYRAINEHEYPYHVIEEDARHVMEAVFSVLRRRSA